LSTSFEGDTAGGSSCSWRLKSLFASSPLNVLKPRIGLGKCDISKSRRMQDSKCRKNILMAYVRERERERERESEVFGRPGSDRLRVLIWI
jgi:hypothetical protein